MVKIIDGIERKITVRKDGYWIYTNDYNKIKYYHKYLAEKYIPNPNNLNCVNHIDGNKSNNSICNLEWTTRRKNCEHARLNGLSERKSQGIRDLTYEEYCLIINMRNEGNTFKKIASKLDRDHRTIWDIVNGKRYKDYKLKMESSVPV